jgi:predicted CopG family antitoxin
MASKQTRKSISITGDAYRALKARCEKDGTSMSGVSERLIREFLDLPNRDELVAKARVAPKVKLVAKELAPETKWVEPAKLDRSDQIRAAADRIEARKEEPVKKVLPDDMASKIFTF